MALASARRLSVQATLPVATWRSSSTRIGSFITLADGNASSAWKLIFSPLTRFVAATPTCTFGPAARAASAATRCWSGLAVGDGVALAGAGVDVGFGLGVPLLAARCWGGVVAGRRSTWPTLSWSALARLLSWISASNGYPVDCEMAHKVSPDLTV